MSQALYKLGRFAARRPLVAIGGWLAVAVVVIVASNALGRDLEDSLDVPGLDSRQADAMLTTAGSERAGLTAQLVLTPRDATVTFRDSDDARNALADVQARAAALPNVLSAGARGGVISPDGRVALLRLQYPVLEQVSRADLDALKALVSKARAGTGLRIEMGGDLFFAFEEA